MVNFAVFSLHGYVCCLAPFRLVVSLSKLTGRYIKITMFKQQSNHFDEYQAKSEDDQVPLQTRIYDSLYASLKESSEVIFPYCFLNKSMQLPIVTVHCVNAFLVRSTRENP